MELIFINYDNNKRISFHLETEGRHFNKTVETFLFVKNVEAYSELFLNIAGGTDPDKMLFDHTEDEIRQIVENGDFAQEWYEGSLPHTLNKILDNPVDMGV